MMPETISAFEAALGLFAGLAGLALIIYALLRADMRQMHGEMLALRTEVKAEIEASEGRLQGKIRETEERLQGNIRDTEERLQGKIQETEERLSAGIKANAERIEAVEGKLSELGERVAQIDGKLEFLYRFITRQNEPPPAAAE